MESPKTAEENATSPTVESPKTEEPKAEEPPKAAEAPLTNGDASPAEECAKPAEEPKPTVEEPPKAAEEPVAKEEPVVAEPPKAEEPAKVDQAPPAVEELTKEVLTESLNEVRQEEVIKDNDTAVKTEVAVVEE